MHIETIHCNANFGSTCIETGLNATKITAANFPLPTLGMTLSNLSREIHTGRGFMVIRGLNPANFSAGDLTMIFMGISAYIGDRIGRQDRTGNCMGKLSPFESTLCRSKE